MGTETLRSIKYSAAEATKLEKLALKLGRPKRQVFLQMVDYFYRTKKDPLDINDDLLKSTMMRNHKDYIGFLKTQENELLIPTKREMGRMIDSQRKVINEFNVLAKQNEEIPGLIERQNRYLSQLETHHRAMATLLKNKEHLKTLFMGIIERYASARDNISAIGSRKEKDQLLASTITHIKLL
ncbi:BfmA/BtgA family mobilization protein [Pedobacter aquatilis]|uniref:BfmA/BtgA family mobilization protein n=1 Tax=Pedobacter aquatilis TaxID=351343 RepID=UPI00292CE2A8|nr:BfmA/BtgA family mobilization protein [Pedobacter aquatilis]